MSGGIKVPVDYENVRNQKTLSSPYKKIINSKIDIEQLAESVRVIGIDRNHR